MLTPIPPCYGNHMPRHRRPDCRRPPRPPNMRGARAREYAPEMDLGLPGDDDPSRRPVRDWLHEHPHPTGRDLAEAGYVVPHWAPHYGLDADPLTQLVIDEELKRANV